MIIFFQHAVHPGKIAFFNYLAKSKLFPFMVYFLSKPAANRQWKASEFEMHFPYKQLSGHKLYVPGNDHSYFHFNFDIIDHLKKDKAEMVLSFGWNYSATWIAFLYCRWSKIPFGLISESTNFEPSFQRTITRPLVSYMVRHSQILIGISTRAKEYFVKLGAAAKNVAVMLSTSFQPAYKPSKTAIAAVRSELQIPVSHTVVLYVGQMIERKGISTLLKSALHLKNELVSFVLIGYGPLESSIRAFCHEHALSNIHLVSYTSANDIWPYYFASNLFVLPSLEETWGLVVNEAMEASLPILLSTAVGCSDDLLKEGSNGFSFKAGDDQTLSKLIMKLHQDSVLRQKLGALSKKIIAKVTPAEQATVLLNQINRFLPKAGV